MASPTKATIFLSGRQHDDFKIYCSGFYRVFLFLDFKLLKEMKGREKMIRYKLVDQDGYTRKGMAGETYWLDGGGEGGKTGGLCTDGVIHYYDHPMLAVLFNPIHANIQPPRLIEIEIDEEKCHESWKGGCRKASFVKELTLPEIKAEQSIAFAIKISLKYYKDADYILWANNWLNGKDRSVSAARAAASSAFEAARNAKSG